MNRVIGKAFNHEDRKTTKTDYFFSFFVVFLSSW